MSKSVPFRRFQDPEYRQKETRQIIFITIYKYVYSGEEGFETGDTEATHLVIECLICSVQRGREGELQSQN
jgi:hypothetical protein